MVKPPECWTRECCGKCAKAQPMPGEEVVKGGHDLRRWMRWMKEQNQEKNAAGKIVEVNEWGEVKEEGREVWE